MRTHRFAWHVLLMEVFLFHLESEFVLVAVVVVLVDTHYNQFVCYHNKLTLSTLMYLTTMCKHRAFHSIF
jgi:hypothetical protein